jgi:PAS domain-containing protein
MTSDPRARPVGQVDFELVFHLLPGMCLVLDPTFTILAQNQEHARATLSAGKNVVGQNLFAAFPDNPDHSAADGVSTVRASLLRVLKTRQPDAMPVIRYDVKPARGPYQVRWWQITNIPVPGDDGYVRWIINRAEDVTELMELRERATTAEGGGHRS